MIILMRQLLNEEFGIAKVQLTRNKMLQTEQILDFDTDVIVATCPSDSQEVLELAMFCKISFALYKPDLAQLLAVFENLKQVQYRQMSKLIYLDSNHFQTHMPLLQSLADDFQLVFTGDYQKIYHDFTFDVRERELDFYFEHEWACC